MEFGANVFWAGFLESVTGLARIFPDAARLVSCSTRLSPGSAGVSARLQSLPARDAIASKKRFDSHLRRCQW